MLDLSIMFLCYERPWTAAGNAVRGQPGSPAVRLPTHDTNLALSAPETSTSEAPAIGSLAFAPLLLKMKIFLSEKAMSSAGQPLNTKGACQVVFDQTNDSLLALHACGVHLGVSLFLDKQCVRVEGMGKALFFLPCKICFWVFFGLIFVRVFFFYPLIMPVKFCIGLQCFRADTGPRPAFN